MFSLPVLPYPVNALEPYIDARTMEFHHDKHHAAYVKNLTDLLPDKTDADLPLILTGLDSVPESIRTRVRNNAGGVFNHSLFWTWMSPEKPAPSASVQKIIAGSFGSMDVLKEKLLTAALGQFGSGWAWLINKDGELSILTTSNQDSPITQGLQPVLGVDVWEHAYYLQYQNRRTDYLQAWWNVVNWTKVAEDLV